MKNTKKWRLHFESIEYPNHDRVSDEEIKKLLYTDCPERENLLRWIAYKMSDEYEAQFDMSKEDLARLFSERGLLKSRYALDFVNANNSEKDQEDSWKLLFSFTRMRNLISPPNINRSAVQKKIAQVFNQCEDKKEENQILSPKIIKNIHPNYLKLEKELEMKLREPCVTIEVLDSDPVECQIEKEAQEIRKEMEGFIEQETSQISKGTEKITDDSEITGLGTPLSEDQIVDILKKGSKDNLGRQVQQLPRKIEWFIEDNLVPRIFIPPGAPPLGMLDMASEKFKVKYETDAPPITVEGKPHVNHSEWDYKVYEVPLNYKYNPPKTEDVN